MGEKLNIAKENQERIIQGYIEKIAETANSYHKAYIASGATGAYNASMAMLFKDYCFGEIDNNLKAEALCRAMENTDGKIDNEAVNGFMGLSKQAEMTAYQILQSAKQIKKLVGASASKRYVEQQPKPVQTALAKLQEKKSEKSKQK